MNIKFCFILFLCYSLNQTGLSQDQNYLNGYILDSLHNPIEFALVVLYGDSNIISFAESDSLGSFQLTYSPDLSKIHIEISKLGYSKLAEEFKNFPNSNSYTYYLNKRDQELEEVVISADKFDILNLGDTTTFGVSGYIEKSDQTLEDVIAKLPGFSISENGTIKINGKQIDKILLEGDDLFGSQYKILSQNINAHVLSEIQILRNYNDNVLLKEFQNSDKTVLNVNFKENKKNILVGDFLIGIGSQFNRNIKLNLGEIHSKFKLFSSSSINDIGNDSRSIVSDVTTNDLSTTDYDNTWYSNRPIQFLERSRENEIAIDGLYSTNNSSVQSTFGMSIKPSARLSIEGRAIFFKDKIINSVSSLREFYNDNILSISEEAVGAATDELFTGQVELKYKRSSSESFEAKFAYSYNQDEFDRGVTSNAVERQEHLSSGIPSYDHHLRYFKIFGKNHLVSLHTYFGKSSASQNASLSPTSFSSFFNQQNRAIIQSLNSQNEYLGHQLRYRIIKNNSQFSFSIFHERSNESLESSVDQALRNDTLFFNDDELTSSKYGMKASYNYSINKTSIAFNVLSMFNEQLNFRHLESSSTLNNSYVNSRVLLKYQLNSNSRIGFVFNYDTQPVDFTNLHSGFIIENYRYAIRGLGSPNFQSSFGVSLYQEFENWEKQFVFSTRLNFLKNTRTLGSSNDIINELHLVSRTFTDVNSSLVGSFAFSKYIGDINSALKLNLSGISSWYDTISEEGLLSNRNNIFSIGFSTTSYVGRHFTVKVSGDADFNFFSSNSFSQKFKSVNKQLKSTITLGANLFDNVVGVSSSFFYYYRDFVANPHFQLFSTDLTYRPKDKKWEIDFKLHNILNENSFSSRINSELHSNVTGITLNPRYVLVSFKTRF